MLHSDSLLSEPIVTILPTSLPREEAYNLPTIVEDTLSWVAVDEEDSNFDSSYYFESSGSISRNHLVHIKIKCRVSNTLATKYIEENNLGVILEDVLLAIKLTNTP